jgi:DNA-binding MarR family transcriptional regulator
MSRDKIMSQSLKLAKQWHSLIGTNDIETKADLARHLGVSRARVTKVLRRLSMFKSTNKEGNTSGEEDLRTAGF